MQAQQGYINALNATAVRGADLIGAVFAINGRVEGAEVYQSTALFRQAWPKLLRAYATEAIASAGSPAEALPSPEAINLFLTSTQQGRTRDRAFASGVLVRDSDIAIFTEIAGRDGHWDYRSYVPKLDLAATPLTPEATIVKVLETGRVGGRSITSLGEAERVILKQLFRQSMDGDNPRPEPRPGALVARDRGIAGSDQHSRTAAALIAAALLLLMFYFLAPALGRRKAQNPRHPSLCQRVSHQLHPGGRNL